MATFVITAEQYQRNYSYALGKLLGQKAVGSSDPANEFSITTTADRDGNGVFLGTYTIETPALSGRATRAAVQAVLDDPNPEQPPVVITREGVLRAKLFDDTITDAELREYLRFRDGLE